MPHSVVSGKAFDTSSDNSWFEKVMLGQIGYPYENKNELRLLTNTIYKS